MTKQHIDSYSKKPIVPTLTGGGAALFLILLLILSDGHVCFGQTKDAIERTEIGNLQNYYSTQDPHYMRVVAQLPNVQSVLNELKTRVTTAQAARPGQFALEFANCLRAINAALRRVNSALQTTEQPQYGDVRALLSASSEQDENRLAKVRACAADLNAAVGG